MKKSIFIFICTTLLVACNQSSDKVEANEQRSHDQVQSAELSLNNGAKWKADSITNNNVLNLRTIADNFRIKSSPSASDYQILSRDLNNALNKMIQQCKMTGADHEALHHWLEAVLKETNELKNITDTALARTTFKSIDKRLNDYQNYFE